MTLILAGHIFEPEQDFWDDTPVANRAYVRAGIFMLSDSAISTDGGRQALDENFPKIRCFRVMIREPQFYPDGAFHCYGPASNAGSVGVAFAGSTLTANAVFERAAVLLEDLRVSCERSLLDGALQYVLQTKTVPNPLTDRAFVTTWGDDTFTPADLAAISIHGAVVACLNTVIEDIFAAKQKIATSAEQFRSWSADFVAASWCARRSTSQLHLFRPNEVTGTDGLLKFPIIHKEITAGELVVLGMRNEFEISAQQCFELARNKKISTLDAMRGFMNRSIEQYRTSTGRKEIGLPVRELRLPA
ncbi:hypothetical protein IQ03_00552 [Gemmobacter caeni]|uniref:Uncharacterized protein n=1 Tax=Gemmobacter caeni TaxID=589035 RepID=A0A2T6BC45_9RHOB|nr:hypothetical protein [Gemmobacter caeni]PTX53633.1 hypothetical protein C8N34_101554 [Gemmobacter caeni]TWJ05744.1 hypothetical protein IQ03_00552 [Gemmobacter caeni]